MPRSMSAASHPRYVQVCMENVCMSFEAVFVQALLNNSYLYHLAKDVFAKRGIESTF